MAIFPVGLAINTCFFYVTCYANTSYLLLNAKYDSTPVRVAVRWPHPSMYPVPRSMCTLHVTLYTKCEFSSFQNRFFFTTKVVNVTDGYLWLCSIVPPSQKVNLPLKITKLFQLQNTPFLMVVACCYNCWTLNIGSLRLTGLETSCVSNVCVCKNAASADIKQSRYISSTSFFWSKGCIIWLIW